MVECAAFLFMFWMLFNAYLTLYLIQALQEIRNEISEGKTVIIKKKEK